MRIFILTVLLFAFYSCSKKGSSVTATSKTTFLAQQSWKFDNAGADPDKNGTIDVNLSSQIPACATDNTLTFSTNGSGVSDEGATKCSAGAPQTSPFTWSFASNETMMNITGSAIAGAGGQFKVLAVNGTLLSLSKDTVLAGINSAFIVNLKH